MVNQRINGLILTHCQIGVTIPSGDQQHSQVLLLNRLIIARSDDVGWISQILQTTKQYARYLHLLLSNPTILTILVDNTCLWTHRLCTGRAPHSSAGIDHPVFGGSGLSLSCERPQPTAPVKLRADASPRWLAPELSSELEHKQL